MPPAKEGTPVKTTKPLPSPRHPRRRFLSALAFSLLLPAAALAGPVQVVDAEATAQSGGTYRFSVTLKHADAGWKHYADRWEILAPDETILGTRTLFHPHVREQPFTRSLGNVAVPPDITRVRIRAHDKLHGDAPALFPVDLPGR